MTQTTILIVPGRGNSEPGHWQSIVETQFSGTQRVRQDWDVTSLEVWSRNIDRAVRALKQPPLVVAHSFGCLATAYAQIVMGTPVGATLFVAPADPERFGLPAQIFSDLLARPGVLLASETDPWLSLAKAISLARSWGVECINLGAAGHVNVASGHGSWPFVEAVIESMRRELDHDAMVSVPHLYRPAGTRAECFAP